MVIGEYLKRSSISQKDFAILVGVSDQAMSRYCSGKRIPRRDEMQRIYEVTFGEVQPNDFYDLPKLENEDVAA